MATPYSPLLVASISLIDSEDVDYGLHIQLVGEDDDGFLLVKNKRGMSESAFPYLCFIGGGETGAEVRGL